MKKLRKRPFAALVLFLSICFTVYSQKNDFGIWSQINGKYSPLKKTDLIFSIAVRTFDNSRKVEQYFAEAGIKYDLYKFLSASFSYRLTKEVENNSELYFRHKFFFDLKYAVTPGRFDLSLRARAQASNKTYITDDDDLDTRYCLRFKPKISYDLKGIPLKPYIYLESFSKLGTGSGQAVSKMRYSFGAELKVSHMISVGAGYIFQKDYIRENADMNILTADINIKF
jgi:hypothetical protein